MNYSEKLKDPRWQKKRLEIFQRDSFQCQSCLETGSTLHVHHKRYSQNDPWDVPNDYLITLCEGCHKWETDGLKSAILKLSNAARTKFLTSDINELAAIISEIKIVHQEGVVLAAIKLFLTDEDNMRQLVKHYFDHLEKKHKSSIDEFPHF